MIPLAALNRLGILTLLDRVENCCNAIEKDPGDPRWGGTVADAIALRERARKFRFMIRNKAENWTVAAEYGEFQRAIAAMNLKVNPDAKRGRKATENLEAPRLRANRQRHEERKAEWQRWQAAAEEVWRKNPQMRKSLRGTAAIIRKQLGLNDSIDTIRDRLKKVEEAR